jgi:hypothetical protein
MTESISIEVIIKRKNEKMCSSCHVLFISDSQPFGSCVPTNQSFSKNVPPNKKYN